MQQRHVGMGSDRSPAALPLPPRLSDGGARRELHRDTWSISRACGHTSRIYLARDRVTQESRGFAFINFSMRQDAENAIAKLDGHGYANLILHVEWAKPREEREPKRDE
jgi:hypothetical protein